jgi:hypothetical protein
MSDVSIPDSGIFSPTWQSTVPYCSESLWFLPLVHLQPTKIWSLHTVTAWYIWKGECPCLYRYNDTTVDCSRSKLLHSNAEESMLVAAFAMSSADSTAKFKKMPCRHFLTHLAPQCSPLLVTACRIPPVQSFLGHHHLQLPVGIHLHIYSVHVLLHSKTILLKYNRYEIMATDTQIPAHIQC